MNSLPEPCEIEVLHPLEQILGIRLLEHLRGFLSRGESDEDMIPTSAN